MLKLLLPGIIMANEWAMNTPGSRYGCNYGYDPLDRLTASTFHTRPGGGWQHDNSFDETGMTYDANGNLLTLSCYGAGGEKTDELAYHYESGSNRLDRIVYNHLNLPELIDFGEGEKIRYTAQGRLVPDGPRYRFEYFMNYTPYAYVYNNPIVLIDPFGLDSVYFFDQSKNPNNRSVYTAEVFHVKEGELVGGEVSGSTYPNHPDTKYGEQNTVAKGAHNFNNESELHTFPGLIKKIGNNKIKIVRVNDEGSEETVIVSLMKKNNNWIISNWNI